MVCARTIHNSAYKPCGGATQRGAALAPSEPRRLRRGAAHQNHTKRRKLFPRHCFSIKGRPRFTADHPLINGGLKIEYSAAHRLKSDFKLPQTSKNSTREREKDVLRHEVHIFVIEGAQTKFLRLG